MKLTTAYRYAKDRILIYRLNRLLKKAKKEELQMFDKIKALWQ